MGLPALCSKRQQVIGEHEAGEIEDLADVVAQAELFGGVQDHRLRIAAREPRGTADAQVVFTVLAQGGDDGPLAEQGLDDERLVRVAAVMGLDQGSDLG